MASLKNYLRIVLYSLVATLLTASAMGCLPLWVIIRGCGVERVTFYEFIRIPSSDLFSDVNNMITMTALLCLPNVFVLALIAFAVIDKTGTTDQSNPTP